MHLSIEQKTATWPELNRPYKVFGPMMSLHDVKSKSATAGFNWYSSNDRVALTKLANYAYDFLAKPNEMVGRSGDVCPFVGNALQKKLFKVTATDCTSIETAESALFELVDAFREIEPISPNQQTPAEGDQIYKALVVAFPRIDDDKAPEIVDALQMRLKGEFIRNGMMIGQFHPNCPEPGLHNPDFRPLQAPVSSLAIRHITKYDLPFMVSRFEHLQGYAALFQNEGRRRIDAMLARKADNTNLSNKAQDDA